MACYGESFTFYHTHIFTEIDLLYTPILLYSYTYIHTHVLTHTYTYVMYTYIHSYAHTAAYMHNCIHAYIPTNFVLKLNVQPYTSND
jgi:hypothetical protein